jgi:hypothetical protein
MSAQVSSPRPVVPNRIPTDLALEWDEAHAAVRVRLLDTLASFGASAAVREYAGALRLYLRSAYLLTLWVHDYAVREELAGDLAMHIVAMKLFDDLLDDDSGLDRYELGYCLLLQHTAIRALAQRAPDPRAVLTTLEHDFVTVGTGQVRTKRQPARSLPEWRAHAETYGACFLGCYGTLAAISSGTPHTAGVANAFGRGFGMLVTIADDLRDYERKGERDGNLGHLLLTGRTTAVELTTLVEQMRALATPPAGGPPMAHDVSPVVDRYADDVLIRMLPLFSAPAGARANRQ